MYLAELTESECVADRHHHVFGRLEVVSSRCSDRDPDSSGPSPLLRWPSRTVMPQSANFAETAGSNTMPRCSAARRAALGDRVDVVADAAVPRGHLRNGHCPGSWSATQRLLRSMFLRFGILALVEGRVKSLALIWRSRSGPTARRHRSRNCRDRQLCLKQLIGVEHVVVERGCRVALVELTDTVSSAM